MASSADSGAKDDPALCGEDQQPQYRTPEPEADGMVHLEMPEPDSDGVVRRSPGEIKAAGVGYIGAMQRIDAALRSSGDAYDQAVADALNIGGLRSRQAQLAALVLDAQSSRDLRSESLAFSVCGMLASSQRDGEQQRLAAPACTMLDARGWAHDDAGNGIPWLYALQQADQTADHAAQREALQQLALATRFETRSGNAAAEVAGLRLRSDADLAAQSTLAVQALGIALGAPFQALTRRCRNMAGGEVGLAATCETIAVRMLDDTDSFIVQMIGGSIYKQMSGDGSRLEQVRRDMRAFGQRRTEKSDDAPCSGERQMLQQLVEVGRHGEVALMKEELKHPTAH